jgi:death-on-curing protein
MTPFKFVSWEELLETHRDQLARYGGQDGFIDENVVRSVMARAQFTAQYEADADVADLAADYMFGLSTTQGFCDGNKRTSFAVAELFLDKNGYQTILTEKLLYIVAISVARGELDRDGLAEILRTHMEEFSDNPPA